jgi:phospholipid/cholesterol/gamma-HCH transport system substrate-binding protein
MTSSRKIALGIFLAGGFILFAFGLFWIGDRRQLFSKSIELYAEFANLSGLQNGAKVRVSGMDAGEVLAINVPTAPGAKFRVKFRALEKFRAILRLDSVASIQNDGLVGNRFLQVEAGSKQAREARNGDTIRSREPVEIGDVIQQVVDTVQQARGAVEEIRQGAGDVIQKIAYVSDQTSELVTDVSGDVQKITASGDKIASDVGDIVAGVKAGRGTVGKLLTDDHLYERVSGTIKSVEQTAQNAQETTTDLRGIVSDLKSDDIAGDVKKTASNVREISEKAKQAFASFAPDGSGEKGVAANLQDTLSNTDEAMSDLAENMEALKHNWFFRGFFKRRGFYDLDAVSVEDYVTGKFAPDRPRVRRWVYETELFVKKPDGSEEMSEEGKQKVDAAMAEFLRYARNNPLIVEGYASQGTADEQFLRARERAEKVRSYLIQKFHLKANYVGVIPMGAAKAVDGKEWDGVSLVLFPSKEENVPAK